MSKRKSLTQVNTLFNYFKSPKVEKESLKDCKISDNKSNEIDDAEEEDFTIKKRKRIAVLEDSDSDSENNQDKQIKKVKASETENVECITPKKNNNASLMEKFSFTPTENRNSTVENMMLDIQSTPKSTKKASVELTQGSDNNWIHNQLPFLRPDKIRDINKNRPDHPNYDYKTLFVPDDFLNNQTPAMRQWWVLKSTHYDCVLFFKVGKFYELYHMDATVGVQHLGFSYMKGEFAHSGFPESAYGKMANALIEKGFKVLRVEQTETPETMAERCKAQKKTTKFDKVVKREVCQISSKGACVLTAQLPETTQTLPLYMYAISGTVIENGYRFGCCFAETSIGQFYLAEFDDDKLFSKLLALFAEHQPGLFLLPKNFKDKFSVFNTHYREVKKEYLIPGSQFLEANKTLDDLFVNKYFNDKNGDFKWPDVFNVIADDRVSKQAYENCIKALGATLWYLKDCKLDYQLFSMKKFKIYEPKNLSAKIQTGQLTPEYMILDAITINNLSLLGGLGSLQHSLDYCETAFGKRLLQQWICRPLCNVKAIQERQIAVKELAENSELLLSSQEILKKLPDLEKQIAKIHIYGNKYLATEHPDSRAIFYEKSTYSKRKILDLLKTLKGFEKVQDLNDIFKNCDSKLLRKITQRDEMFLDIRDTLQFFREAFDQETAAKDGVIIPKQGLDEDYDSAEQAIADIQDELNAYLEKQCRFFGCSVKYFGSDKKRFQLEVPESHTKKATDEYQLEGTKKGGKPCKRYSTSETRRLLQAMLKAESNRAKIVQDLNRRVFERFSQHYPEWEQVTHCLTYLDVLCSFANYYLKYAHDICMPIVKEWKENETGFIHLKDARHPCIQNLDNFVPNDLDMNINGKSGIVLITGPNMGGKSTLMRQTSLLTIMAQLGSYVPALECELTLVDRIFTRLGAHDNIMAGQSTFFVELSEAATILQHASEHSLVLLDELGRGTSTHDGNAIASAYVDKLRQIRCRTLFSTHYHSLVDRFVNYSDIQLGHMACMIENDEDPVQESVVFLYKMVEGRCPKSYGFNAARLAGLKHSVVVKGKEIAAMFEKQTKNRNMFKNLFNSECSAVTEIRTLLKNLLAEK